MVSKYWFKQLKNHRSSHWFLDCLLESKICFLRKFSSLERKHFGDTQLYGNSQLMFLRKRHPVSCAGGNSVKDCSGEHTHPAFLIWGLRVMLERYNQILGE